MADYGHALLLATTCARPGCGRAGAYCVSDVDGAQICVIHAVAEEHAAAAAATPV